MIYICLHYDDTIMLTNISDSKLFRHFLRGYFDGDGCICESFSNKNLITTSLYTTITGSNMFIDALYIILQEILSIKGNTQCKGNSYNYLPRKYNLYNKIIVNSDRKKRKLGDLQDVADYFKV